MSFGEQNPYASPQFVSPQVPTQNSEGLATRSARLAGAILDNIICGVVGVVVGLAMGAALLGAGYQPESLAFKALSGVLGTALGSGIYLMFNGYLLATRGQSIGKIVMKTKIVADDGSPMPFVSLILKRYVPIWLVSNIPIVGAVIAVIDVLMIFRQNHKCLHDDLAGTKVIAVE